MQDNIMARREAARAESRRLAIGIGAMLVFAAGVVAAFAVNRLTARKPAADVAARPVFAGAGPDTWGPRPAVLPPANAPPANPPVTPAPDPARPKPAMPAAGRLEQGGAPRASIQPGAVIPVPRTGLPGIGISGLPGSEEAEGGDGFIPVPGLKRRGGNPAAQLPLGETLAPIVAKLKGKVAKDRVNAAQQLGGMGEAAAPASRYLCSALLDPVPAVSTAALKALETVAPELYEPFATICVDQNEYNRLQAVRRFGKLRERGQPAVPFLVVCLAAEAAGRPTPTATNLDRPEREYHVRALQESLREIGDESEETLKAYRVIAGPGCVDGAIRFDAMGYLMGWAADDEERRATVAPLFIAGLSDPHCRFGCVVVLGTYGKLARPALPTLRRLKLDTKAEFREAATKAVAAIEAAE